MARAADVHLCVKVAKEACPLGLAPTSSTTATLVMGDALAVALLKARGFTAEDFATSPQATWRGNFRELSASVTRMATFATSGRITLDVVEDEINRLRYNWQESRPSALTALLGVAALMLITPQVGDSAQRHQQRSRANQHDVVFGILSAIVSCRLPVVREAA